MIRRKTETRGRYDVGVYEVDIDVDMRRDALQFAKDIILSDNQYSRLLPENIKNSIRIFLLPKIILVSWVLQNLCLNSMSSKVKTR